jgi:hypothetical protein
MGADGFVFQKRLTLQGPGSGGANQRVTQTASEWLDTGDNRLVVVRAVVSFLSECTLQIQTSPTRDSAESGGQWRTVVTINGTTTGANYVLDASPGATYGLDRFVRWQVVSAGTISSPP